MKANDITKLTAELKSDIVQYRDKIYYRCCFVFVASIDRYLKQCTHSKTNLAHPHYWTQVS